MKNQNKGAIVLELDEMWHYIEKKSKLWIWKAFCRDTGELVDWECGARDAKTLKVMLDRLKALDVSVFFTDHWECYRELIPEGMLVQTKAEIHGIEWNNFRQRHWCGRFRSVLPTLNLRI